MIKSDFVVSYAQNREDIILAGFFSNQIEPGFYVDIGANHPTHDSVTKYFYDLGWHGINIEPNPDLFQDIIKKRTRDTNLNIGIGSKKGNLKLRAYKNHGLSTFSKELKDDYKKNSDRGTEEFVDISVPIQKLADVLRKHKVKDIWFMKIDVEGFEYEVIDSNEWGTFRPWVLCIEANHITKDWHTILEEQRYSKVFFDGLNEYFVAEEKKDIAANFSYPEAVLLGKPVIDWRANSLQEQYLREIRAYKAELEQKNAIIEESDRKISSLRWAISNVFHAIKNRYRGKK